LSRPQKLLALIAAAAVAGGVGLALLWRPDDAPEIAGFVYPEPRAISPFTLRGQDGKPFDLDSLKGRWSFVYFGYSYCPDACPTTLAELARAQQALEAKGLDSANQYVFVSVDPQRDTPQRLAQYVAFFDKKFVGATGSDEALTGLTRQLGIAYSFPEGKKGDRYAVDHSSIVVLFDPEARLHAVFTPPQAAEGIAEGFRKILEKRARVGRIG
jgi:protein SCO1/2